MKNFNIQSNSKNEHGMSKVGLICIIIIIIIIARVSKFNLLGKTDETNKNEGNSLQNTEPLTLTEAEIREMIGKEIVGYNPIIEGTYKSNGYTPDSKYTGYTETTTKQEAFKTENLKWKIWNIDENNIYLISETPTSAQLGLGTKASNNTDETKKGAQGYNNGVEILNEICKICYTDSNFSDIEVRSLNISDIEELKSRNIMTYDYEQGGILRRSTEYGIIYN